MAGRLVCQLAADHAEASRDQDQGKQRLAIEVPGGEPENQGGYCEAGQCEGCMNVLFGFHGDSIQEAELTGCSCRLPVVRGIGRQCGQAIADG